jgi:hypothetical protein
MHVDTRHWRTKSAGIATMVFLLLVTAGCALSPVDRDARDYERMDAQIRSAERFETLRRKCRAAGGVVVVQGNWGKTKPRAGDTKMARCGTAIDNALTQSLSFMP